MTKSPIDQLNGPPAFEEEAPPETVGYCNPPKAHQFKKGQQGNPKGRPKHSKNLKTDIKEVLNEPVSVKSSKGTKSVTSRRGIMMTLTRKALQGDAKSALALFKMEMELHPPEIGSDGQMPTREEDLKIIEDRDAWLAKFKKDEPT